MERAKHSTLKFARAAISILPSVLFLAHFIDEEFAYVTFTFARRLEEPTRGTRDELAHRPHWRRDDSRGRPSATTTPARPRTSTKLRRHPAVQCRSCASPLEPAARHEADLGTSAGLTVVASAARGARSAPRRCRHAVRSRQTSSQEPSHRNRCTSIFAADGSNHAESPRSSLARPYRWQSRGTDPAAACGRRPRDALLGRRRARAERASRAARASGPCTSRRGGTCRRAALRHSRWIVHVCCTIHRPRRSCCSVSGGECMARTRNSESDRIDHSIDTIGR